MHLAIRVLEKMGEENVMNLLAEKDANMDERMNSQKLVHTLSFEKSAEEMSHIKMAVEVW